LAIGEHFGGRDHATVLHACHKLEEVPGDARLRLDRLERALAPWRIAKPMVPPGGTSM
jgi:hypothetical protein